MSGFVLSLKIATCFECFLYIRRRIISRMPDSKVSFDLLPLHFVLLLGSLMGIIALVSGYCPVPGTCNSDPSKFGHSSDEVEYSFVVREKDCSGNPFMGVCQESCNSGETAVSGSCETTRGWGNLFLGALDGSTYQCIDASFIPGSTTLIVRVVCMG